jgi:Fe-S-cluster-containing hydrogenase component 2
VCAENCPEDAIHFEETAFAVDAEACTGCGICIEVCPFDVMVAQKESDVPVKCNLCGECSRTCPRGAILLVEEQTSEVA